MHRAVSRCLLISGQLSPGWRTGIGSLVGCMVVVCSSTRGVEAFLKKTAIAYHQNLAFLLGSPPYAIAVFFKNASTPRVDSDDAAKVCTRAADEVDGF